MSILLLLLGYALVGLITTVPVARAVIKYGPSSTHPARHILNREERIRIHWVWLAIAIVFSVELLMLALHMAETAPFNDGEESWAETRVIFTYVAAALVLIAGCVQLFVSFDSYSYKETRTLTYARTSGWVAAFAWPAVLPGVVLLGSMLGLVSATRGIVTAIVKFMDPFIVGPRGRALAAREDDR